MSLQAKAFILLNNSYHLVSSFSRAGTVLIAFYIILFNSHRTDIILYFIAQASELKAMPKVTPR